MTKQITQKEARTKYGIVVSKIQKLAGVKFYLKDNGEVVDNFGDVRYIPETKQTKELKALELLAEQSEFYSDKKNDMIKRLKAYDVLYKFIMKNK